MSTRDSAFELAFHRKYGNYLEGCRAEPDFSMCFEASNCWDGRESTASCWTLVMVQLGLAVAAFIYSALIQRGYGIGDVARAWNILQFQSEDDLHRMRNPSVFTSHKRTEANFVRDNLDPEFEMPPLYRPEFHVYTLTQQSLYLHGFRNRLFMAQLWTSIGWGVPKLSIKLLARLLAHPVRFWHLLPLHH